MLSSDLVLGVLCGALCLLASACVGAHEILLGPDRPNYPDAPGRLRVPMFVWAGVLLYRGVELISAALQPQPPMVSLGLFMGAFMVALVHGLLLEAHLRQWLPARVHARIRLLLSIATCGRSRALREERARANAALRPGVRGGSTDPAVAATAMAELTLRGVRVVAPNEGVEALLDPEPLGREGLRP